MTGDEGPPPEQLDTDDPEPKSIDLDFSVLNESWSEYQVDGDKVRVQLVIREFRQLVDENLEPQTWESGERQFSIVFSLNVVDEFNKEVRE